MWKQELARKAAAAALPKVVNPALPSGTEISLSGTVQGKHIVEVPASIEGFIETFHVELGQEVFEGQLLASIKNTRLDSARELAASELERTQTRLSNTEGSIIAARLEASRAAADASRTQNEFDRLNKLFQRQVALMREGATPKLTYQKVEKEFLAARAENENVQSLAKAMEERVSSLLSEAERTRKLLNEKAEELEHAKSDLAATEVHSPVDGIIIAVKGEVGTDVDRNTKDLFMIATELSDMQVTVEPEPPLLARLAAGQPAIVILAEANNEPLPAQLLEIKGTQAVIDFKSPTTEIKPGLTAQVRLKIK